MITLEEAKQAYRSKAPVIYHHPMIERNIVCTIGALEFSEKYGYLKRVTLKQSDNSYIIARPQDVSTMQNTKDKYRTELAKAFEELDNLRKEGFLYEE